MQNGAGGPTDRVPSRGDRHEDRPRGGRVTPMPDTGAVVKRAMRLPLAHRFRLAWRLAVSPRVPLRARLPLALLLMYLAMPLDIIPDFIPVLGQLDDVLVAGIAVWWFLRTCPPEVALDEIERLESTPLGRIGRSLPWLLGVCLGALAALALYAGVRRWR
jgi:uncharacterized membrane protein YkvA (DUF1232 family)